MKISEFDRAGVRMTQILREGDLPVKIVYTEMAEIDIGSRTAEKAKKELNIVTYRAGGGWYWRLPQICTKEKRHERTRKDI